jgi:hypothetical protein
MGRERGERSEIEKIQALSFGSKRKTCIPCNQTEIKNRCLYLGCECIFLVNGIGTCPLASLYVW